ncbi:hypothetical protein A9Q91_05475 [Candidatus Gracilibacteria bacterium 28_42_T64]|nr:hypothetical protein A9Q91_05475 [Candidatus Gracilibacteria bacterium 28_42_T64]
MIISIFASIGSQNLGDELILKNEIKILEEKYGSDTQFYVFTYDIENPFYVANNVEYVEYFPINVKKPQNFLRNKNNFSCFLSVVKKSDLIVVGGGGIIYDTELQSVKNPLNQWAFRSTLFKFFNKKVLFYAIGLNIKNRKNYKKIKQIFSGNTEVTVRDSYSYNLLEELGIESKIILDPVFSDDGDSQEFLKNTKLIKKINCSKFDMRAMKGIDLSGKKVGIAFRKGYLKNEIRSIEKIIENIQSQGGTVILISNSFHQTDNLANDYSFLEYFARKYDLKITKDMQESYDIYKQKKVDICFGMRLHSMILSQVYGINFIAFSYSKKTDEILKILT